ncbi:MAG: 4-(cytidine 5'-diphospho)-2-C-methyl-D-erythritol kinase [Planctomycetes bacterium]|nr:4-(cytidine 5'-diphospho)-2-C-methyl-D-erythritol kinase [Planctomycetota bacterium]
MFASEQGADGGEVVRSPAKINWTLGVHRKRPDGFHEISSLISLVTLYDELSFSDGAGPGLVLECDRSEVPTDRSNLVYRAAELLASRAGRIVGLRCRLAKRIPVGGGLGGGSSNGASTLMALNRRWELGWSTGQLAELAAELGSDVALFLEQGSAVVSGRGETVRPTTLGWRGWIVLLIPGLHVSTAGVYRSWRAGQQQAGPVEPGSAADAVDWMERTFNMLEAPAIEACPQLGALQRHAAEIAQRPVRMSGSGSTLFTAFNTRDEADGFSRAAGGRLGVRTEVVQPVEQVGERT